MAANEIIIPFQNPLRFYRTTPAYLPQYISRHMDEYLYLNTLEDFQIMQKYEQKWQTSDAIKMQYQSTFASIQLQLIDCSGNVYMTQVANQERINRFDQTKYIYQNTISLAAVPPGLYWWVLTLGGTEKMISEPQRIQVEHPGTMLWEYKNSRYHGEVLYETGIEFSFRVESFFRDINAGNERTAYRDQRYNPVVLKSIPYRSWEVIVGKDYGVPDWVATTFNWILSCDNVHCDGKPYAVLEDSSIEGLDIDSIYPMRPYTVRLQEGINRSSLHLGIEVDPNKRLLVVMPIDGTVFGAIQESGNNIITILDIE